MWIISVLILILILGIIILVHEFGHFIWAKKFNVHIYEFSIGMGPVVHTHKGKDGIDYNIRAFPIGGFVSMAGEVYEDNDTDEIPKEKFMCNRPWWQRIIILLAGVTNNFILALILLFFSSLIWGGSSLEPIVKETVQGYPMAESGISSGDEILAINGKKTSTWDVAQIILAMKNKNTQEYYFNQVEYEDGSIIYLPVVASKNVANISLVEETDDSYQYLVEYNDGNTADIEIEKIVSTDSTGNTLEVKSTELITKDSREYTFKYKNSENGEINETTVHPIIEVSDDEERDVFGIQVASTELSGFLGSIKYAFVKFGSIMESMWLTITGLITGKISLTALSGPVGMYQVVDQARSIGIDYLVYITAFLSINVGFINVLPFPAFDGGRVFFLIVEKIKGSPINSKFENTCHMVGFVLLMLLMIYITIQDIIRLF